MKREMLKQEPTITIWEGCYDLGWKNLIVEAAYSHPAKFARGLIQRIIDVGIERGYWKPGDLLADPFGGVALGGVIAGYNGVNWLGVELEEKFVSLGNQNIELHAGAFKDRGVSIKLVQGDSRKFADVIKRESAGVVTSAPFLGGGIGVSCTNVGNVVNNNRQCVSRNRPDSVGNGQTPRTLEYGDTSPGQIGNMPEGQLMGIITSPPYAETVQGTAKDHTVVRQRMEEKGYSKASIRKVSEHSNDACWTYGDTPGQIGAMQDKGLAGVITSPPYADTGIATAVGGGQVDASLIRKSLQLKAQGKKGVDLGNTRQRLETKQYGATDGQIGAMPVGVITSPPYAETGIAGGGSSPGNAGLNKSRNRLDGPLLVVKPGYGATDGNIGNMPAGVITSPPYADASVDTHNRMSTFVGSKEEGKTLRAAQYRQKLDAAPCTEYGTTPGNIGSMTPGDVEGVVTAPPFTKGYATGGGTNPYHETTVDRTDGNIELTDNNTYWGAMKQVYLECAKSVRPGGVLAIVVKDYVKAGRRVLLCDQTAELLTALGFEVFERVYAMVVKEDRHKGLFGDDEVKITARKSFFRKLAEAKGSPEINYEEVIWCRVPTSKQQLGAAGVITSPPYAETPVVSGNPMGYCRRPLSERPSDKYGATPGQIGAMPSGSLPLPKVARQQLPCQTRQRL